MSRASSYGMATTSVVAKIQPFLKYATFFKKNIFVTKNRIFIPCKDR